MGFIPQSGQHALIEVVFGFAFTRQLIPKEIALVRTLQEVLKDSLPRVNDIGLHQVTFDGQGNVQPTIIPQTGVIFERIKPDGNIAWRLSVDQNAILVNCLEYEGWEQVWPQARSYAELAFQKLSEGEVPVSAIIFQTIDGFYWEGDLAECDPSKLLKIDGTHVPTSLGDRGVLWHLHQGWFEFDLQDLPGKTLHRVHLDANHNPAANNRPEVRMDTTLQLNLHAPVAGQNICEDGGVLEKAFQVLHDRNKQIMKDYLSEAMCEMIKL